MIDHIPQQDQTRAVTRVIRNRVSIEHGGKSLAVGDAGKDRDQFTVALEGVKFDGAVAIRQFCQTGTPDKGLGRFVGENIRQFRKRHALRLDDEERIQDPVDISVGRCNRIAITGKGLQLALLVAQSPARRCADAVLRFATRSHRHHGAGIGRRLSGEERQRIDNVLPALRLLREGQNIDAVAFATDRRDERVEFCAGYGLREIAAP